MALTITEMKTNTDKLIRCACCCNKIDKNVFPQYIDNSTDCNLICKQCHEDTLIESDICKHCNGSGVEPMGLFGCTECLGEGTSI
jgi:hypothetical protein